MTRNITFAPSEYYHLYNRGADKRITFLDKADHERFISLLYLCNSGIPIHRSDHAKASLEDIFLIPRETTLVDIGAYCLMPNHFHLLVREHSEQGLSMFMQKLTTAYVMYFNRRHMRTGVLFEGKYKAQHVDDDNYLKYLFAYIHLNPIGIIDSSWKEHRIKNKNAAEKQINSYAYSSFLDYENDTMPRRASSILNKIAFPEYFEKPKDFNDYINDWIEGQTDDVKS